jgi:hypothetical protein
MFFTLLIVTFVRVVLVIDFKHKCFELNEVFYREIEIMDLAREINKQETR